MTSIYLTQTCLEACDIWQVLHIIQPVIKKKKTKFTDDFRENSSQQKHVIKSQLEQEPYKEGRLQKSKKYKNGSVRNCKRGRDFSKSAANASVAVEHGASFPLSGKLYLRWHSYLEQRNRWTNSQSFYCTLWVRCLQNTSCSKNFLLNLFAQQVHHTKRRIGHNRLHQHPLFVSIEAAFPMPFQRIWSNSYRIQLSLHCWIPDSGRASSMNLQASLRITPTHIPMDYLLLGLNYQKEINDETNILSTKSNDFNDYLRPGSNV